MATNPNSYSGSFGNAQVGVVDSITNAVTIISLPAIAGNFSSVDLLTLTPDGKWLYVLSRNSQTIFTIDTSTNAIIATNTYTGFAVESGECGSTNNFAYFAARTGIIIIIDTATNTPAYFNTGTGTNFNALVVTPDQQWVYVDNPGPGLVFWMDTLSNAPTVHTLNISTLHPGANPQALFSTIDSAFVYVADSNLSFAYKITAGTATYTAIALASSIQGVLAFATDANNVVVYAGDQVTQNLFVINISSNAVTTFLAAGFNWNRPVTINDNTTYAYWGGSAAQVVTIPNATPAIQTGLALTSAASRGAVSPNGLRLHVGTLTSGTAILDTSTIPPTLVVYAATGSDIRSVVAQYFPFGPPAGLHVGDLYIPRKGRAGIGGGYEDQDLIIDFLAIENWANHDWSPAVVNLFLPAKPVGRPMTMAELDQNWRALEEWADALGTVGGVAIRPLLVPRKGSLEEVDWDRDFWAIQTWANSLNP